MIHLKLAIYIILSSLEGIQRRETKIIKIRRYYSYREKLKKLGLATLQERSISDYQIEIFKTINWTSNNGRHFFDIFSRTEYLQSWHISETKKPTKFPYWEI